MKIILTQAKKITSKKNGVDYVIFSGISAEGKTIKDQIVSAAKFEENGKSHSLALSKDDLSSIFTTYESVDISFNDEGRVETIS